MSAFIVELAGWVADNTALTYGTDFFVRGIPDQAGTMAALLEEDPLDTDVPRAFGLSAEFRAKGESAESITDEVFSWLLDRDGADQLPEGFALDNWSVKILKVNTSRPKTEGVNAADEPIWFFPFSIIYTAR